MESDLRRKLQQEAERISSENNDSPVVVIIAGSKDAEVGACTAAWANLGEDREGRMRDLLGILEAAKQIEAHRHLNRPR